MMLPMSSQAAYLRIFTWPVSVSTACAQVRAVRVVEVHRVERRVGVERGLHAVRQVVRRECAATSAVSCPGRGAPGRVPAALNSTSSADASSRWAAMTLAFSMTLSTAFTSASPPTTSDREP